MADKVVKKIADAVSKILNDEWKDYLSDIREDEVDYVNDDMFKEDLELFLMQYLFDDGLLSDGIDLGVQQSMQNLSAQIDKKFKRDYTNIKISWPELMKMNSYTPKKDL